MSELLFLAYFMRKMLIFTEIWNFKSYTNTEDSQDNADIQMCHVSGTHEL